MNTEPQNTQALNRIALLSAMERMRSLKVVDPSSSEAKKYKDKAFLHFNDYDRPYGCNTYRCVLGWYCHWIGVPIKDTSIGGQPAVWWALKHFGLDSYEQAEQLFGSNRFGSLEDRINVLKETINEDRR